MAGGNEVHKAGTIGRLIAALALTIPLGSTTSAQLLSTDAWLAKLDPLVHARLSMTGRSRVIVRATDPASLPLIGTLVQLEGGIVGRELPIIEGLAADVPNLAIETLARSTLVRRISFDRVAAASLDRTGGATGAAAIRNQFGYDGSGVGVAIIDSGVTRWHDDLTDAHAGQRIDKFIDYAAGRSAPYDDHGHGTHVAGIVAGNGFDSAGARSGIAPGARLTILKALDGSGRGRISDVIAALGYVAENRHRSDIRVVNLSIAAGVYESYHHDPLTVAAQRVVQSGVVVVAAAGNAGKHWLGHTQYGGVTAPGNAPWVLTVGAASHMGTVARVDDTMAAFSSRGPTAVDYAAKPDLVAPGVGIESLSDPLSAFYTAKSQYLLPGTVATPYLPYLSLSGTSMAAPVVTGTVALMLQANPALTPNQVKAVLQYTAEVHRSFNALTQGAGFLNAAGAVTLARYLASPATVPYPSSAGWSRLIIWGNQAARGGRFTASATAWPADVTWGARTAAGRAITWGELCTTDTCESGSGVWQLDASDLRNVVWGAACGGADCTLPWTTALASDAVRTTSDGETVVWGTGDDADTVVWGTAGADGDTVVWGTSGDEGDTVVWGTSCTHASCEPVMWGDP